MPLPSLDDVVRELRTITEDDSIGPDSQFASMGVDSLDVLEWIYELEEQLGFQLDEDLYEKESLATATVRDFYERLKASAPS